jgi:hypothetical protein
VAIVVMVPTVRPPDEERLIVACAPPENADGRAPWRGPGRRWIGAYAR